MDKRYGWKLWHFMYLEIICWGISCFSVLMVCLFETMRKEGINVSCSVGEKEKINNSRIAEIHCTSSHVFLLFFLFFISLFVSCISLQLNIFNFYFLFLLPVIQFIFILLILILSCVLVCRKLHRLLLS